MSTGVAGVVAHGLASRLASNAPLTQLLVANDGWLECVESLNISDVRHVVEDGGPGGNRTRIAGLEDRCSVH